MAVKAINDTLSPECLVPPSLVFGELPHTRMPKSKLFYIWAHSDGLHSQCWNAVDNSEDENRTASSTLSHHHRMNLRTKDQVLVWNEKAVNKRIWEWLGPFIVLGMNPGNKLVYVYDTKIGPLRPMNFAQLKRYQAPITSCLFCHIANLLRLLALRDMHCVPKFNNTSEWCDYRYS